jgi:hypothetical protein
MKKNLPLLTALIVLSISITSFTSCMTTKTNVGTYKEEPGLQYTYAKGKQVWLFWGIVPLGRTNVNTPGDGDCQVVTRLNIIDFLVSGLTAGIVTTQTIKVNAKKVRNNPPAQTK